MKTIKKIAPAETYGIRKKILRKNIDLPHEFKGDFDKATFHLGAFKNGTIVGVASFMKSDFEVFQKEAFQLRGMATIVEVRGEGFGSSLINEACRILKTTSTNILWCNAREIALEFYKHNDFQIIGLPFEVPKIGMHFKMIRNLD